MHRRPVRLSAAAALAAAALSALAAGAPASGAPRPAPPATTVTYQCSAPGLGSVSIQAQVSGTARVTTDGAIVLSGTRFRIKNTSGIALTAEDLKVAVADPDATSAPYVRGSAATGTSPAGWTAGHGSAGAYLLHAGQATVGIGASERTAALRARYRDDGPAGTVVDFVAGAVHLQLVSPVSAAVTCTPQDPVPFASVTE